MAARRTIQRYWPPPVLPPELLLPDEPPGRPPPERPPPLLLPDVLSGASLPGMPPPEVPLPELPEDPLGGVSVPPLELPPGGGGEDGEVPGALPDSEGGGVVAGADCPGWLPPVAPVPLCSPPLPPPPRLQAARLTDTSPSTRRIFDACSFGFIVVPFN